MEIYSKSFKTYVQLETRDGESIICSPIGSEYDGKILTTLDDLVITEKLQRNDSKVTERLQRDDSKMTDGLQQSNSKITPNPHKKKAIAKARGFIPVKILEAEVEKRWPIILLFQQPSCYKKSQSASNFSELLSKFKAGDLSNVPRSVVECINEKMNMTYTIPYYNNTIEMYIKYESKNRPPKWLIGLNNLLGTVDNVMTLIIIKLLR